MENSLLLRSQTLTDSSTNDTVRAGKTLNFNQFVVDPIKNIDLNEITLTSTLDNDFDIISQLIRDIKYLRLKNSGAFSIRICVLITTSLII